MTTTPMNNPTPHELAAAREILDMLVVSASKPYQMVDVDGLASIIAKHRSEEVKELQQAASHNADWFDSLVNDLSKIVESDKRPSDVISKVIELQRKAKAFEALERLTNKDPIAIWQGAFADSEHNIRLGRVGAPIFTISSMDPDGTESNEDNIGEGQSLLEAIESAMKGQQ